MNILRQQDILKGVPDQRLMQEMQSPSGSVPQFLVMSEMQRRKGMRDEFTSRQESPSTVAEDLVGVEKAQAGLGPQPLGVGQSPTTIQAGLPQPAQPAPPVMMESGGVVKYQEGTGGIGVRSDEDLIELYKQIDSEGRLNGSADAANEVLGELQVRKIIVGANPYTQNVSSLTERLIKGPQALGRTDETSQPTLLGKAGDTVAPVPLASMSNNNLRLPRNIAPDSLTGGESTLELLSEVGKENITAPSITDGSPIEGVARGAGGIPPTETFVSQGLPYSDEGLGGRDNLYRPTVDFLDKMGVDVSPSGPKPEIPADALDASRAFADKVRKQRERRALELKNRMGLQQQISKLNRENLGQNVLNTASPFFPLLMDRRDPTEEASAKALREKEISKLIAQAQPLPPEVGLPYSDEGLGGEAFGPMDNVQRPRVDIDPIVPRGARPVNPVASVGSTLANVSPVVLGSDQEAINRADGVASSGEFDIRSDDAGLNVTKEQNKVAEKIQENPALAYEKMRKDGISDAQAMGLIMAGLGIMEAASQPGATALGSLSGAKAGVQQYSKDLQALNERIEKRRLADETTRLKEAQLDISEMQAGAAKTSAEAAMLRAQEGNPKAAALQIAEAMSKATPAERKILEKVLVLLRPPRPTTDKTVDIKKKLNDARTAYVKGNEIGPAARKIYMANPKFKNASPREKGIMINDAKRRATDNHMFREFGNLYQPASVGPSKSNRKPITSYD